MTPRESSAAEDAALLARVAGGDEPAFLALYERFSAPLYSLLLKMLQNRQDAEDTLQTVFLQIWRKAGVYDPARCAAFTWLVLIARSKAFDRLRQRQRQTRTLDAASLEEQGAPLLDESPGVLQHEDQAAIRAALAEIPAEQREALEMAYFKGLSQTEVAEALGEPLGTIKARIRRGMLRLRDHLTRRLT